MARWKKEGLNLKPLWKFKCLGCGDPMAGFKEMGYLLLNFPIHSDRQYEYHSYALDRQYSCVLCGWQINFGIALTKEHFEAVLERDKKLGRGDSLMEQRSADESNKWTSRT